VARRDLKRRVEELLAYADVEIGGSRLWDIQVDDERLYARVMAQGSLGLGESYMDGWWDGDKLDEFFYRVLRARLEERVRPLSDGLRAVRAGLINLQRPSRAFEIGRRHYDIGNELYRCMLDRRMTYSCGYWKDATTLDEAQEAKLDLVCRKLGLRPGMWVLDIGCGWGGAAQFAAERYGVAAVGITVSEEQVKLAREMCEGVFVIEDWHNFGTDCEETLMAWYRNFAAGWDRLSDRYDERFRRMWTNYLLSCAGSFRARKLQLWQIVLSPGGVAGGYLALR